MCIVVNKYKSEYDVDIQRGTMWGNPHSTQKGLSLTAAIDMYKIHIKQQIRTGIITKQDLLALHGKRLGCTCSPKPCHGDIIAEIVNRLAGTHNSLDI